jgi:hypothetical protein
MLNETREVTRRGANSKLILTIGNTEKIEWKIIGGSCIKMSLRNGNMINYRRRIPVGIQVVVGLLEWHRICPEFVQDSRKILRIGGYSVFISRNGDIIHL